MKIKDKRKQKEFMKVYEPIHENFVRFCKARSHGVMAYDDLVNESVLKAYQNWMKIDKKDSLLYFLFSTATNIVRNTVRKKKEISLDEKGHSNYAADSTAENDLEIAYLYEQLDKLSDTKKEALILFEINGFSIKEVAEIQGSTEGAVKVMLSRARKELKALMVDEPHYVTEDSIVNDG
ncbi:MAG: RNA polymerase sigma-70 factor (ECF subfamily) [Crocinitomix sp.]